MIPITAEAYRASRWRLGRRGSTPCDLSTLDRLLRGAVEGPIVRPELGPCLDFRRPVRPMHYPTVRDVGSVVRTLQGNRVVLENALGRPLRPGYLALHLCDRKNCLRASHLYEGTRTDNQIDRVNRTGHQFVGKFMGGEAAPSSKLVEHEVLAIRSLAAAGMTQCVLAKQFGVSNTQIARIVSGQRWAYLDMGNIRTPGVLVEAK